MQEPGSINLQAIFISLIVVLTAPQVDAQSWVQEGAREFEELRLRQLQTVQNDAVISAFSSDGCSGGQSKSWDLLARSTPGFADHFGDIPPWESCCVAHDKLYWRGSSVNGFAERMRADLNLKQCVAETGVELAPELSLKYSMPEAKIQQAFSLAADLMYQAVRLGGQPCSLLPWRWGYGWDNCAFASISEIPKNVSDLKNDENLVFFNSTAWFDDNAAAWQIAIHAWVYEPQDSQLRKGVFAGLLESSYDLKVSPGNEANFSRRSNLLIADNERGKTLVIRIAGQDISLLPTAENGKVLTTLNLPGEVVKAFANEGRLSYFAVLPNNDNRQFRGEVKLVPRNGISVISDIDDTVKISNVTDRRQLFDSAFFKNFQPAPEMSELYRRLATNDVAIHYVSSSPWQLYDPLQEFMEDEGFPWATLNLKDARFRDETLIDLFKKGTATKPAQIEPILQQYPGRRFILIGDSGEQDPEVYGDIARRYPQLIHRILIRNVDNSEADDVRYQQAFNGITGDQWQLFDHPRQLSVDDLLKPR